MMGREVRTTGIGIVGDVPWGTHLCQFYKTKEDLTDILVPYFKAGLENNEFCMWVTSEPLRAEEAKKALAEKVKDLDAYVAKGQIEIFDYSQWYTRSGGFDAEKVLQGWVEKERQARKNGFDGLRLTGNTLWLEEEQWREFTEYEAAVNSVIGKYRMLAICTYCLDKCGASQVVDVACNHEFALIRREGRWEIIESRKHKETVEALRQSEEKFRLAFENAVDAIFWADPETGLITNCNRAAEILLGKDKVDVVGRHETTLHPADKEAYYRDLFSQHATTGRMYAGDAEVVSKSGKIKPVSITASVTSVGGRRIIQGIFRDITERRKAEEALAASREQYRALFEQAPDAIVLVDGETGTFVDFNDKAPENLGYSREEFRKLKIADIDVLESEQRVLQHAKKVVAEGADTFETRMRTRSGEIRDVLVSARSICLYGKKFISSVWRDITEHKQAQAALRESEEKFRNLAEQSPNMIFINKGGRVVYANEGCERVMGYKREEFYSPDFDFLTLVAEEHRESMTANFRRHMRGEDVLPLEYALITKGGRRIEAILTTKLLKYDGEWAILGIVTDITGRKKTEEELKSSEQKLKTLIEGAPIGIYLNDLEGKFLYGNEKAERIIGCKREGLVGKSFFELGILSPEGMDRARELLTLNRAGKRTGPDEFVLGRGDGTKRVVEVSTVVIGVEGRQAVLGMVQDVTERTRAEEALKGEKEFTETALNAQTDTFFVFEPSTGKAVRWNKAFNRISGYSDEEIRSMKAPDSYYNEQDLKKAAAATERVLEEGVASVELSLITKDGRPIPTEYTASAIRDGNGNPKYIIAVGRDITERKQAAEVLRESEEKYRAIFEEAADSIVLVDPATGGLVEFNDRTSEMLGYTREELGKLTIADLDVVESAEEVANHIKKVLRKGGDTFETKRRAKNGAILDILVNCRTISIGGRDLILSIWRDITEQKRVQRQVRSLARFPSENPNPVLRISKDCTIVYANEPSLPVLETWERRQGQRLPEVCGQRVKEALSSGKVRTFEFECKDGRAFFVTLAPVADGSYANAYGVDITERRQAEEQVRRARDEWERTFNSVPDLIAIVDSNYRIQRVNRAMAERLGCEPEQAVGLTCYEVVHGTDAPPEFCPHRRLVVDGKEHSAEIHEDKLGGDFIISVSPLCSDDGELMGSVHVARDITDRVQAEHALRESEAKHRALVEQVPAISYTAALDEECTTLYISPQVEQILGFTPQEWQQEKDKWVQQLSPEDRERVLSEWESSRAAGTQFVSEYRVMARDGRAVWVRDEAVVVSDDKGRPICVQGLMFDITERKRAEQALKESEEKFRNLAEQSPNMIFINKGGKVAYANARCEEVMGYKREEFYSPNFDFLSLIAPESRDLIKRSYRRHLKGGDVGPVEYALVTREGERIDAILTTKLIQYDGGKAILGTVTDITERKRAEEALRESENRFQTLARLSPVGIFRTDGEGNCLYVNERWCDIAGLSREEALTEGWAGGLHPEDRKRVYERWHESVRENIPFREEYRFKRSDGEANWVFGQATPERDENGYVVGYIGTITDITERKQAEEALRQSEQKHRHLIETMKEGLGVTDQNYIFTYVNDSFCEMLGYSRDEMLGHHQIEFIDDDYKGLMKEQIAKRIKGEARSYEMGWRAKDGRTVYTLISPAAFFDASGNFTGSLAALTDITERKEAEVCQQLTGEVLQVLNQESRARELIRAVLDLIRAATGFAAVGIRLREGEDFPYFEVNGFSDDFVEAENYLCARDEKGELIRDLEGRPLLECMCGNILSGRTDPALPFFTEGGSFWTNSTTRLLRSTTSRERQGGTRNRCNQAGYESVALIPLRWGEQIVGLLQLNDNWPGRFTPEMIRFFEGMCTSIGIALARIRAEENIESVAKFPSEDPYPVLRVAADGTVLYTNSAGSELLKEWRCDVGTYVPRQWYQYIRRILESGLRGELETACGDRVFSLTAAPIVKAGYVNIYGTDITERKQAEEDLREYRQHLERLVQARTVELTEINEELLQQIEQRKQLEREILDISEREKRLIGQELHDSIGQQFTGIAFMTKVLEQRLAARLPDEAGSAAAIAKLVNQAMEQARGLAKGLHPMDLDGGSLVSALRELVRTTERLFGVHCTFKCEKAVWVEDGANAVHLYRIAQEAVTNAIKHGKARHIRMKLAGGSDQSVLTIQNDGVDFPEKLDEKGAGMGLHIMNHRVEIIGGSLDIRSGPEGGTVVTCAFPNTKP